MQHKDAAEWLEVGNEGKVLKEFIILYVGNFLPLLHSRTTWVT
jgi:hypothetical protein